MHLRKQAVQPRRNSTPFTKNNQKWVDCPTCDGIKRDVAKYCRQCSVKNRRAPVPKRVFFIEKEPCRWIPLTQGQKAIVDAAEYNRLSQWYWFAMYSVTSKSYYAARWNNDRKKILTLARAVAGEGGECVDHKNHNTLDYRRSNLRKCSNTQNMANTKRSRTNKSGFKGVSWNTTAKKWQATIYHDGRVYYLGAYNNREEAARVRNAAAQYVHGEFAWQNPVSSRNRLHS